MNNGRNNKGKKKISTRSASVAHSSQKNNSVSPLTHTEIDHSSFDNMDKKKPVISKQDASKEESPPRKKKRLVLVSPSSLKESRPPAAAKPVKNPYSVEGTVEKQLEKMKKMGVNQDKIDKAKVIAISLGTLTNDIIIVFREKTNNTPSPYIKPYTDFLKMEAHAQIKRKLGIRFMGFECDPNNPAEYRGITKTNKSGYERVCWCDVFVCAGDPDEPEKNTIEVRTAFAEKVVEYHNRPHIQKDYQYSVESKMVHIADYEPMPGQKAPATSTILGTRGTLDFLRVIFREEGLNVSDPGPSNEELLDNESSKMYFTPEHWELLNRSHPLNVDHDDNDADSIESFVL